MGSYCDFFINTITETGNYPLENYFNQDIQKFHKSLPGYSPTPLNEELLSIPGQENLSFYIKDESKRFSPGAFKTLGASWAINSFLKENKSNYTFVSATDGNHGRAVAWSTRMFGHRSKIFMPVSTVAARIESIEKEGALVTVVNGDYDQAVRQAQKESMKKDHILIQDTSWEGYEHFPNLICAGYTTILEEILNTGQLDDNQVDAIFLQSGVGSWAASTLLYLKKIHKFRRTKMIIVEPYESDCLLESAKHGKISTTRKSQDTIMAGLNCGTPSEYAWRIINDLSDAYVSIDDQYSEKAIRVLHNMGYDTCESGAAGLAALIALYKSSDLAKLKDYMGFNSKSRFLVFNTEGVTDPEMFNRIISEKTAL